MAKGLTTGNIAQICGVSPKTAGTWIDTGELEGHRIGCKGGGDRRVTPENLRRFMKQRGMPTDALDEFLGTSTTTTITILVVGNEIDQPIESEGLTVVRCENLFEALLVCRDKTDIFLVWWELVEQNREFLDFARTHELRIFAVRPDGVEFRDEIIEEYFTPEVVSALVPSRAKKGG
jgi:hypothetical protein